MKQLTKKQKRKYLLEAARCVAEVKNCTVRDALKWLLEQKEIKKVMEN